MNLKKLKQKKTLIISIRAIIYLNKILSSSTSSIHLPYCFIYPPAK